MRLGLGWLRSGHDCGGCRSGVGGRGPRRGERRREPSCDVSCGSCVWSTTGACVMCLCVSICTLYGTCVVSVSSSDRCTLGAETPGLAARITSESRLGVLGVQSVAALPGCFTEMKARRGALRFSEWTHGPCLGGPCPRPHPSTPPQEAARQDCCASRLGCSAPQRRGSPCAPCRARCARWLSRRPASSTRFAPTSLT